VTANGYLVADSDMHVFEPADVWQRYIDPAWRHAAPVGLTEMRRDMRVKVKSHVLLRQGAVRTQGERNAWKEENEGPYSEAERRGWSPDSQRDAMDAEGLDLAVLFPFRKGGGLVEAPDARMVGTKGEYLFRAGYLPCPTSACPRTSRGDASISPPTRRATWTGTVLPIDGGYLACPA
jgi:hypothetical protein